MPKRHMQIVVHTLYTNFVCVCCLLLYIVSTSHSEMIVSFLQKHFSPENRDGTRRRTFTSRRCPHYTGNRKFECYLPAAESRLSANSTYLKTVATTAFECTATRLRDSTAVVASSSPQISDISESDDATVAIFLHNYDSTSSVFVNQNFFSSAVSTGILQ